MLSPKNVPELLLKDIIGVLIALLQDVERQVLHRIAKYINSSSQLFQLLELYSISNVYCNPPFQVQVEALGALRNLALSGVDGIHERLVAANILEPLTVLFGLWVADVPQAMATIASSTSGEELLLRVVAEQTLTVLLPQCLFRDAISSSCVLTHRQGIEHVGHLLWELCENVDSAVTMFNSSQVRVNPPPPPNVHELKS